MAEQKIYVVGFRDLRGGLFEVTDEGFERVELGDGIAATGEIVALPSGKLAFVGVEETKNGTLMVLDPTTGEIERIDLPGVVLGSDTVMSVVGDKLIVETGSCTYGEYWDR